MDKIVANVEKWVHETFVKCGYPYFKTTIKIEWKAFTRKMGDASYAHNRVRFSSLLFPRASVEQQRNTAVHEACHIVCKHKYPHAKPHGREWKSLMRFCGEKPERTHNVDRKGLTKTHTVHCKCRIHQMGTTSFNRLSRGVKYFCKFCKTAISPGEGKEGKAAAHDAPSQKQKPIMSPIIDRQFVKVLQMDVTLLLEELGKKHGLQIRTKGAWSFDSHNILFKCEAAVIEGDNAMTSEMRALLAHLSYYGWTVEQIKKPFKIGKKTYKLVGMVARRGKYPLIALCLENNKKYKMSAAQVHYS
jgi:SprT protein